MTASALYLLLQGVWRLNDHTLLNFASHVIPGGEYFGHSDDQVLPLLIRATVVLGSFTTFASKRHLAYTICPVSEVSVGRKIMLAWSSWLRHLDCSGRYIRGDGLTTSLFGWKKRLPHVSLIPISVRCRIWSLPCFLGLG